MSAQFALPFANETTSKLYLESDLADIHFVFPNDDDQIAKVPAHKVILASASPVFKEMFYGLVKEGVTVEITDSNANAFKEFLQIIYLSDVTLTTGNIKEMVRLADKYDILDCFNATAIERQLTNENMVYGYQLAIALNNSKLKEFCEKQMRKFTNDVLKSAGFLQCSHEVLENILQQNALDCTEADLFHACISWAKFQCQNNGLEKPNSVDLKKQLGECFHLIRFDAMDDEEIQEILSNKDYRSIFTQDEVELMQAKCDKLQLESRMEPKTMGQPHIDLQTPVYDFIDVNVHAINLPDELIGKQNQIVDVCNNILITFAELFSLELPFLELSDDGQLIVNVPVENHNMLKAQANFYENLIHSHDVNASNKTQQKSSPVEKISSADLLEPVQPQTIKHVNIECTLFNSSNTQPIPYRKISIPSRNAKVKNLHLKIASEFLSSVSTTSAPTLATKILNKKKIYYAMNLKFDVNAAKYLA